MMPTRQDRKVNEYNRAKLLKEQEIIDVLNEMLAELRRLNVATATTKQ